MTQEKKPSKKDERLSTPRKAIEALRQSKGYVEIQHFYKSKLQYMQLAVERDHDQGFVLGYN